MKAHPEAYFARPLGQHTVVPTVINSSGVEKKSIKGHRESINQRLKGISLKDIDEMIQRWSDRYADFPADDAIKEKKRLIAEGVGTFDLSYRRAEDFSQIADGSTEHKCPWRVKIFCATLRDEKWLSKIFFTAKL